MTGVIPVALGAAVLFAVGNLFEKNGLHNASQAASGRGIAALVGRILSNLHWWGGMAFSSVGTLLYYAATARHELSLVQLLLALNPVLTALGGWLLLKEHLDRRTALAILVVAAGLGCTGFGLSQDSGVVRNSWLWPFAAVVTLLALLVGRIGGREIRDSALSGVGFGLSVVFWKSLSIAHQGWSGGLADTVSRVGELATDPRTWAFIVAYTGGFLASQSALIVGRALFVIPFSSAIGAAIPIAGGVLVFGDSFPPARMAAVALVMAGLALFVRRPQVV